MDVTLRTRWMKAAILLSFLIMVTVNALANALPINGLTTGEAANRFENLFTPAPLTFAIWGAIYLLLGVYVVFQLVRGQAEPDPERQRLLGRVGRWFIFSSLLNAAWIFAWHYQRITMSMAIMALLLVSLTRIGWLLRAPHCSPREELALRMPFGLYFGWITVATIANAVVWLVRVGWDRWGIDAPVWMAVLLVVGAVIAGVTMYRIRNVTYGLAVLWAYAGILNRHLSAQWYNGQYPLVVWTTVVSLAVLLAVLVVTAIHMRRVAACDL
ncbi:MAG: tryptophan-rich sensory protein [Clostridiales bacterium]|nr:tryptophan-rich sensory protein [Clostridiales bacterium]